MGAVPDTVGIWAESIVGVVSVGLVRVLFVNVSVVVLPTIVSVTSGNVNVLLVFEFGDRRVNTPSPTLLA